MTRRGPHNPPVSDHAVLRWLERHGHVNVEAVRRQIYEETREALRAGASRLTINGTEYRIEGGVVVTIVDVRRTCGKLDWPKR